jgi:cytidine deaminase
MTHDSGANNAPLAIPEEPTAAVWEQLRQRATEIRNRAYAPYSHFAVGAAIVLNNGEIFAGCNVENASFGLSICAERTAIVQAVCAGPVRIHAVAIVAEPWAGPCGACRQFIYQFGPDAWVRAYLPDQPAAVRQWTARQLLPDGFEF